MKQAGDVLSLSLISHTNVGKTTLARTLLRRDVGEVLDQAHVTEESERYVMLESESTEQDELDGGRIVLWDTPGFGDSARLYRELAGREEPLDWLAEQHFDPVSQRSLHSSQGAVLNVRREADVVLYLVNASEDPAMAGYVDPEMHILGWMDRPVIVLLNQMGSPADAEGRRREEERWRWHLASHAAVNDVIGLDAFSRCWVQEGLLLLRLEALVPEAHRARMTKLLERWSADNLAILAESARAIAGLVWAAACDREPIGEGMFGRFERKGAIEALVARLDRESRAALDRLIELHGLEGEMATGARGELADVQVPGDRPDPRRAGALGSVAGGALGGLVADLAHGGLTLGGGMLAGALLGGLGLGGLAWGYEQLGEGDAPKVVWSTAFLDRQLRDALLRYLAIAHFGRGAGAFRSRVEPAFWAPAVERALARQQAATSRLWREARAEQPSAEPPDALAGLVDATLRALLVDLYPGAERMIGGRRS